MAGVGYSSRHLDEVEICEPFEDEARWDIARQVWVRPRRKPVAEPPKLVPITQAPDQDVIEKLESFLEKARSGELRSVALGGTTQDGDVVTAIVNNSVTSILMLGVLTRMQLRYHNAVCDEE